MTSRFFILGIAVGIVLIAIGGISIFLSLDPFAFARGMILIITGIIIIGLGIRFKAMGM